MHRWCRTPFRLARALASAALLGLAAAGACAQDRYPNQPIHLVVPYAPGGTTDLIARTLADQLGRELGQTVIVENRPGASTNIGSLSVARARADGYTLLFGSNSLAVNPAFGPVPSFEPRALEPIGLVARIAFVLAANPQLAVNTPAELVAAAKAAPGTLSVASAQLDLYVEMLSRAAAVKLNHVPYKGGAPAVTDAIAGQVNMVFTLVPVVLPQIQTGKLKAIAVTSPKRQAVLPEVPSFVERGVDFATTAWYGLLAPPGTPRPIVDRLAAATQKVLNAPDTAARIRAVGAEAVSSRPDDLRAQLQAETVMWQQTAKQLPQLVQK